MNPNPQGWQSAERSKRSERSERSQEQPQAQMRARGWPGARSVHARPRGTGACAASGSSAASATRCNPRHGRAHLGEQGRGVCTRAPGPMTGPERSAERSERSERSEQSQAQPKARVRAPRGTGPSTRARYTAVRAQGARFTSLVAPSTVPLASNLGHIPARAVARRAAPGAPLVAFNTLPRDLNLGLAPSTCACDSTARARAVGRRPPARPRAPRRPARRSRARVVPGPRPVVGPS